MRKITDFKSYLLYGAGTSLGYCVKYLESVGVNIKAVFDSDDSKWGQRVEGYMVLPPELLLSNYSSDIGIIVSAKNHMVDIARMLEQIPCGANSLVAYTNAVMEAHRYRPDIISENWTKIKRIANLFSDIDSAEYYKSYIELTVERDPLCLKSNRRFVEFASYNTSLCDTKINKGGVFLDCGAFLGVNALKFSSASENSKVFLLEPNPVVYAELQEKYKSSSNILAINKAVGSQKCALPLYKGKGITMQAALGENYHLMRDYDIVDVPVETIDDISYDMDRVDCIYMDIEGSEPDALIGAETTIKKFRPQMYVSAYHKVRHLWEIPEIVMEINPNYKMFFIHPKHVEIEPMFLFVE